MKHLIFAALSLCLYLPVSLAACSKSEEGKSASGGKGVASSKGAKATALGTLGIKADLPGGTRVGKGIMGDGVLIQGDNLVVGVELANDAHAATLAAAKDSADMYSPKNVKSEKLADGFVFTFENKGSMGKNYFVHVRRKLGGKDYWCSTTATRPAQATNAVKVCKSLKQ